MKKNNTHKNHLKTKIYSPYTIWVLINRKYKTAYVALLIFSLFIAAIEIIGIGSVVGFISLASNPDLIDAYKPIGRVRAILGIADTAVLIQYIGVAVIIFLALRGGVIFTEFWMRTKFTVSLAQSISARLFNAYVAEDITRYHGDNTGVMLRNIYVESASVSSYLSALSEIISGGVVSIFILAALISQEPELTLIAFGVVLTVYLVFYRFLKTIAANLGVKIAQLNAGRYKIALDSLRLFREIKFFEKERAFSDKLAKVLREFSRNQVKTKTIRAIPRLVVEAMILIMVIVYILVILRSGQSLLDVADTIALFAMALMRIIPRLDSIVRNFLSLRITRGSLDAIYGDLISPKVLPKKSSENRMSFERVIQGRQLNYVYGEENSNAITNMSFEIRKGERVAFVGPSGAGKSTLLDLLTVFLTPTSGSILVDNVALNPQNAREFRRIMGYVSQKVEVFDSSVAANIAMCADEEDIDIERVMAVAKTALVDDHIVHSMPDGYWSRVGEGGTQVSGGQLQRLGIARALYHDPKILLFDEATGALDRTTEQKVNELIENIGRDMTIITVTHRMSSVTNADRIYVLDAGRIVDSGTFSELQARSPLFCSLI